jgi:uncharacterized protein DUF4375
MAALATEDDWRMLWDYLAAIDRKIEAAGGRTWDCLSATERTVITAYFFEMEFCNGEMEQFFINPSGDRWRETLAALKTIGATRVAELFERAVAVFPNGTPSADQLTRCHQYEALGEMGRNVMQRVSDEWYENLKRFPNEDLYQVLIAYVRNNAMRAGESEAGRTSG